MEQVFNWCMIGAGTLGKSVAKEITRSGRHKIVSVYTRREDACREFAGKYGALACSSAEEAITAPGVDGVYVVTPHNSHYQYAKLALELGKPVLCEKPFTMNAGEARELFELAQSKGLYIAEAMWTWFAPTAHKVKQWLDAGEFGDLEEIYINYHMDVRRYAPRLTDPKRAGGALLDSGIYPITYLYRLFGKPVRVICEGILENGIDMSEDVTMTFADGRTVTASISMRDFKGLERLKIRGTKAKTSILLFHAAKGAKLIRKNGKKEVFKGDGSMLNEFDQVAAEIRQGLTESRFVPAQATVDVMEILDECRRQMGLVYPFEKHI